MQGHHSTSKLLQEETCDDEAGSSGGLGSTMPAAVSSAMGAIAQRQRFVAAISAVSHSASYCITSGVFLATGARLASLQTHAFLDRSLTRVSIRCM